MLLLGVPHSGRLISMRKFLNFLRKPLTWIPLSASFIAGVFTDQEVGISDPTLIESTAILAQVVSWIALGISVWQYLLKEKFYKISKTPLKGILGIGLSISIGLFAGAAFSLPSQSVRFAIDPAEKARFESSQETAELEEQSTVEEEAVPANSSKPTAEVTAEAQYGALEAQKSAILEDFGPVVSGFKTSEVSQFKSVLKNLNAFAVAAKSKNSSSVIALCKELKKTDDSLLPIHQRVNNMNVVTKKFDKYWGLASYFLFEANMHCGKVNASNMKLLDDLKITLLYSRSEFYFDKIIVESGAQRLSNQDQVDAQQLADAIAEEDEFFAEITARTKAYFTKNAGLTSSGVKTLETFKPYLVNYEKSLASSNFVSIAAACSALEQTYPSLTPISSSSFIYEETLDRVKDYAFEGIEDCKKGFKKNRISLLIDAGSKFTTSKGYLDSLLKFAKQNS
jgi:hypothetical protein